LRHKRIDVVDAFFIEAAANRQASVLPTAGGEADPPCW